jgi:hypothetical protein
LSARALARHGWPRTDADKTPISTHFNCKQPSPPRGHQWPPQVIHTDGPNRTPRPYLTLTACVSNAVMNNPPCALMTSSLTAPNDVNCARVPRASKHTQNRTHAHTQKCTARATLNHAVTRRWKGSAEARGTSSAAFFVASFSATQVSTFCFLFSARRNHWCARWRDVAAVAVAGGEMVDVRVEAVLATGCARHRDAAL